MRRTRRLLAAVFTLSLLLGCLLPNALKALAEGREEQLQKKIDQIVAGIPAAATSDVAKALYLHDYIVRNVAYEKVGDHQSAHGALLDGKAVCAGYADAYLRLLTAVGIRARTISGTADNGSGVSQAHTWTMLYLDGECLFTDVTWDDPFVNGVQDPDNVSYDYFNLTMEQMHADHFPDTESQQYLPASCNHTGYDFYTLHQGEGTGYGIFSSTTTAMEAAKYFKFSGKSEGLDTFSCEFRFDSEDPQQWISNNWVQIAQELGLTGSLSTSFQTGGYTVKLTVKGTLVSSVAVTSVSISPSSVTLRAIGETAQLTVTVLPASATDKTVSYASSNPQVAAVTSAGLVMAVGEGTATITATTRDSGKIATCKVTVSVPAQPPTEETTPTATLPTQSTEPATEPDQSTETVPQPTDPATPVSPSEPASGNEPIGTAVPTAPSGAQSTTGAAEPTQPTENQPMSSVPTQLPAGNETGQDNTVVIIAALCGGVLITVLLILLLKKRR